MFPSINEGWGLVVLEAMSVGLPVVTSDIEVFQEFLIHRENALMTSAGDAESLAGGMTLLQADTALAQKLAANGRALVSRYSWAESARQHLAIYDAVTTGPIPAVDHARPGS